MKQVLLYLLLGGVIYSSYAQTVTIVASDTFPCIGDSVTFTLDIQGGTPTSIIWETPTIFSQAGSPIESFLIDPLIGGEYDYEAEVTFPGQVITASVKLYIGPFFNDMVEVAMVEDRGDPIDCELDIIGAIVGGSHLNFFNFPPMNVDYELYDSNDSLVFTDAKIITEYGGMGEQAKLSVGQINEDIFPGNYKLLALSYYNSTCPSVDSSEVVIPGKSTISTSSLAPSCTNLGEITVDVQAGFGSKEMFTISLTNDITFANETVNLLGSSVSYTFTNLDPGIYSIIVEDETFKNPNTIFTGCNTFYTVTLLSSALEFDASVSAGGCPGDSVGSIDLTVSSSTGPVSFDWSTGDTTEDISHLVPGMYTVTVSDSSGCIVQDSFVVDTAANCPTNNDISLRSLIHIFPNPTTNILQVESENLTIQQIQLFDLRGRMLMEKREQTDILDLHGLSQGIYILEVQTDQGILTEKIIKQ